MPDLAAPQYELLRLEPEAEAKPKRRKQTDEERRRKHADYIRLWRTKNQERARAISRATQQRYREKHPERVAASNRRYRENHQERLAERKREWNKGHSHAAWKAANPEKVREYKRRWALAHPEYARDYDVKRRSMKTIYSSPERIYGLIIAALPKGLPRHVRDDVSSSLCLAILEGKAVVKHIGREVGEYLKAYNREYDTFKTVSLDETIAGTTMTRLDKLAAR